jgi:hypothetical protein
MNTDQLHGSFSLSEALLLQLKQDHFVQQHTSSSLRRQLPHVTTMNSTGVQLKQHLPLVGSRLEGFGTTERSV